jgi:hypothetical protein
MKLPEDVREFFRRTGKIGAEKRHAGMSPERRREVARMAANARWAKASSKKKARKKKSE